MGFEYRDGHLVSVNGRAAGEAGGKPKAHRSKLAAKVVVADEADLGGKSKPRRSRAVAAKAVAANVREQAKPGRTATRPTTKTTNRKRGQRRLHPSGDPASSPGDTHAANSEDPAITAARKIWSQGLLAQRRQKEARRRKAEQSAQQTAEAQALWEVANSTNKAQDGKRHRAANDSASIGSAAELWRSSRANSESESESPGGRRSDTSPVTVSPKEGHSPVETTPGIQQRASRNGRQGRTGGEKRRIRERQLQAKVIIQWKKIQGRQGERRLTKFVMKEAMKEPSDKRVHDNMRELRGRTTET